MPLRFGVLVSAKVFSLFYRARRRMPSLDDEFGLTEVQQVKKRNGYNVADIVVVFWAARLGRPKSGCLTACRLSL
jgi:hypothetical protein